MRYLRNENGAIGFLVAALCALFFGMLLLAEGGEDRGQNALVRMRSFLMDLHNWADASEDTEVYIESVPNQRLLDDLEGSEISLHKGDEAALHIDLDTFKYLLKTCIGYEESPSKEVKITVQGFHEYVEKYLDASGAICYRDVEEYVKKPINVSNKDFEKGQAMDWRQLYLYCVLYKAWSERGFVSDTLTKEAVDEVFDRLKITYHYDFDVMRVPGAYYDFNTCKELPHTEDIYGDPDTEEGRYTWYYPHSQLSYADSGSSHINVVSSGNKCTGITEIFSPENYRLFLDFIQPKMDSSYVYAMAADLPGGERLLNEIINYESIAMQSGEQQIIRQNSFEFFLADGDLASMSAQIGYGGLAYRSDFGFPGKFSGAAYSTIGEAAVALALSRLDWKYSMAEKLRGKTGYWDCSSMICRVYAELGLDINAGGTTSYLLRRARDNGQEISEEELQAGDIILFKTKRGVEAGNLDGVGHVVMWCGDGTIVHAKGSDYGTVQQTWQSYGNRENIIAYVRPYIGFEIPDTFSTIKSATDYGGVYGKLENVGVAARIWTYCKKKGMTDFAAAALIGNATQESSLNPYCDEYEESGKGTGMGLFQWSGTRTTAFLSWMKGSGYELSSVEAQCEYLFRENDWIKDYPITYSKKAGGMKVPRKSTVGSLTEFAIYNFSSVEEATRDFGYCWERMHEDNANWPRRLGAAQDALELFGGKTDVTTSGKASADGTFENGQKIYFSDYTGAEFAEFSALHTGYATYYKATNNSKGITVCLNAGHGTSGGTKVKTLAHPDGTPKYVSGTNAAGDTKSYAISSGTETRGGVSEASINLKVAVLTCSELLSRGYDVVMIRDNDNKNPVLDNIARTVIANETSDCHLALHFDGDNLSYDKGCFYMGVPDIAAYKAMYPVSNCWQEHERLGKALVNGMVAKGVKKWSDGRLANDLTQTSYSTIPSVDIEYGNQSSDFTDGYLSKIATGLADGVDIFFRN